MLEIKNASISVGGHVLFTDLSFAANDSEVSCIVGKHLAGKTVLLKSLMGLFTLLNGHISIDGELLTLASAVEFRRHIISYVPQSPVMDTNTVGELANMLFSLDANKGKPLPKTLLLEEWQRLGLADDTYDKSPQSLTMGERQRALLGIVCMQNKPIVLADEPDFGLDAQQVQTVAAYLRSRAERGQTVIVTSSDENFGDMCNKKLYI